MDEGRRVISLNGMSGEIMDDKPKIKVATYRLKSDTNFEVVGSVLREGKLFWQIRTPDGSVILFTDAFFKNYMERVT